MSIFLAKRFSIQKLMAVDVSKSHQNRETKDRPQLVRTSALFNQEAVQQRECRSARQAVSRGLYLWDFSVEGA